VYFSTLFTSKRVCNIGLPEANELPGSLMFRSSASGFESCRVYFSKSSLTF
jgi:hypothetical protein